MLILNYFFKMKDKYLIVAICFEMERYIGEPVYYWFKEMFTILFFVISTDTITLVSIKCI